MKPDDFDIYEIPMGPTTPLSEGRSLKDLGWYSIQGFSDRGAGYRLVVDKEGSKLTYYRPADWTDEDWDEFCNEMEEDVLGGDNRD